MDRVKIFENDSFMLNMFTKIENRSKLGLINRFSPKSFVFLSPDKKHED
jgi:hypothetical protein